MNRLAIALMLSLAAATVPAAIITGSVYDAETGEALASVTIRVTGTGTTSLTSPAGDYRLSLEPGEHQLRFSHVGHYSQDVQVAMGKEAVVRDVELRRAFIEVSSVRVFDRAFDPAQQIIAQAIRRKQEILTQLNKYDFDAYQRLMVRDSSEEDSASVLMIAESQVQGFWEYPHEYKEIVVARRQTANLDGDGVLALIPAFNFNQSRMDFGAQSVISPTAEDALEHYNYYLLDTIEVDGWTVFHLEVEPKSENDPLFVGTIDIADSTYEVTDVSLKFTEGVDLPYVSDLKFEQRHARFENEYWMPVEILISGCLDVPIPGIPELAFELRKAIANYRFETEHQAGLFDYIIEIAPTVDDVDSATWDAGPVIPLTPLEERGYRYHDSVATAPRPITKKMLGGAFWLIGRALSRDNSRFNRAEGVYLGWRQAWQPKFATSFTVKAGYAIDAERFEHRMTWQQRLWQRRRLDLTAEHFHHILGRPSVISGPDYNSSVWALLLRRDPVDYYREEGFDFGLALSPYKCWRIGVSYHDAQQYSSAITTQYSMFNRDDPWRINPGVDSGRLRSLTGWLEYDSRPVLKMKRREEKAFDLPFTFLRLSAEQADPDWISNDFDFARYALRISRAQRSLGLGVTRLEAFVGLSDRRLPVQRLFTVDFGDAVMGSTMNFKTLGDQGYSGDRVASVYLRHEFGTQLWKMTSLPLIRDIPFSLGIQGGAFVTDFYRKADRPSVDSTAVGEGHYFHPAPRAYREIGFSIGRIPPVNLRLFFNWQLSDYDTNSFRIDWSLLF
ncbi:MAG: DUF5686 family protein [bacterium]